MRSNKCRPRPIVPLNLGHVTDMTYPAAKAIAEAILVIESHANG